MSGFQASCVAIGHRALLITGAPGSGKSSLALGLIDRGARLIGDDSVELLALHDRLLARPHPNTQGLLEVRNLGLIKLPVCAEAPVALMISLDETARRYVETAETTGISGIALPTLRLWPGSPIQPIKAELALERFGLMF